MLSQFAADYYYSKQGCLAYQAVELEVTFPGILPKHKELGKPFINFFPHMGFFLVEAGVSFYYILYSELSNI